MKLIKLFVMLISSHQLLNLIDRSTWHFLTDFKNDLNVDTYGPSTHANKPTTLAHLQKETETGNIY